MTAFADTAALLAAAQAAWPEILAAALHPDAREHRKDAPEAHQHVHPSDPPHNFSVHARGVVRPGPLPPLRTEIPVGVRQETQTGRFRTADFMNTRLEDPIAILRMGLEGQARHWVVEARRRQATAVKAGAVSIEGDLLVVSVVLALARIEEPKNEAKA